MHNQKIIKCGPCGTGKCRTRTLKDHLWMYVVFHLNISQQCDIFWPVGLLYGVLRHLKSALGAARHSPAWGLSSESRISKQVIAPELRSRQCFNAEFVASFVHYCQKIYARALPRSSPYRPHAEQGLIGFKSGPDSACLEPTVVNLEMAPNKPKLWLDKNSNA